MSFESGYFRIIEGLPFKSVETPVANKPLDATASEPPRSTSVFD